MGENKAKVLEVSPLGICTLVSEPRKLLGEFH